MRSLVTALLVAAACASAQPGTGRIQSLAPGKLLVANPDLPDPNFSRTVVVLVHYGGGGAVGLILNRQSEITAARALPKWDLKRHESVFVHLGGPVERRGVMALFRSRSESRDALKVTADIYWTTNRKEIERAADGTLRLFLGHSGWGPGQLEQEIKLGAWHVLPADDTVILDSETNTLYKRMLERSQLRMAGGASLLLQTNPDRMGIRRLSVGNNVGHSGDGLEYAVLASLRDLDNAHTRNGARAHVRIRGQRIRTAQRHEHVLAVWR